MSELWLDAVDELNDIIEQKDKRIAELEVEFRKYRALSSQQYHRMLHKYERCFERYTALVDGLRGKIDLFENRRSTATNADSKSLWHIVSNELRDLLGDEEAV